MPSQIDMLSKILSEKEYIKSQFGDKEIKRRIYKALNNASLSEYKYLYAVYFKRQAHRVVGKLIQLGLKKYE